MLFRVLDELPAVIEGHRCGDLGCCMFPVLHCGHAHRHVPLPRRGVEDEVELLGFAQAFEVAWSARVGSRFFVPCIDDPLLHEFDALFSDVAHRRDTHAGNVQHIADIGPALASNAHESDPDFGNRRRREAGQSVPAGC